MEVVEAVRLAPEPVEVPPEHRVLDDAGQYPRWVLPGIDEAVARAATDLVPLSALNLPWTRQAAVQRG